MTYTIHRTVLNDIIEALTQCAEYMEERMDANGDSEGGYYPNEEMQLYTLCNQALEELPRLTPSSTPWVKKPLERELEARRIPTREDVERMFAAKDKTEV